MKKVHISVFTILAGFLSAFVLTTTVLNVETAKAADLCNGTCVSVGPRLASVDSTRATMLNAVLGGLLNSNINVSVVDWNAIATSEINLLDLLAALQADLSLATPADALTANVTIAQILSAAADVAQADGNVPLEVAINNLAAALPALTDTIQIGDFLSISYPDEAFSQVDLNVLEFLSGSIQLFNFENVVGTPTPVTISGADLGVGGILNQVQLYAQVIEPPVYTCGVEGEQFHTAAIRLKLDLDLIDISLNLSALETVLEGLLGIGYDVELTSNVTDLSLYVEVAQGDGTIQSIDTIADTVSLQVTPGVVDLYLGDIADAVFFNRSVIINEAVDLGFGTIGDFHAEVTLLAVPVINTTVGMEARAHADGAAPFATILNYTGPYPETQTADTGAGFITNLVSTLMTDLEIQFDGSLGVLDPLVNGTILPAVRTLVITAIQGPILTPVLTDVVDPMLELV
jgi:uncharacterized membrane protein